MSQVWWFTHATVKADVKGQVCKLGGKHDICVEMASSTTGTTESISGASSDEVKI